MNNENRILELLENIAKELFPNKIKKTYTYDCICKDCGTMTVVIESLDSPENYVKKSLCYRCNGNALNIHGNVYEIEKVIF